MDSGRSKRNVLRATLAASVLFLTALFSSAIQSSRTADCSMPPERPRALDLSQPADRQHLDADLSLMVRTAARYRQSFGDIPSASSIHAAATAKSRPDRA